MKSVVILTIIIVVTFGYTQAPDTLWTRTYGGPSNDVGNSIKQTSDGGYIIAGYTESFGAGQQDVWLLKTDPNGDTVWTKTYGTVYNDVANYVQQTADSGYVIVGTTQDDDIWLIKTDHLGDSTWTKRYVTTYFVERGNCVQQITDGGYIITGRRYISLLGPGCVVLLKTDANGDTVWCREYYFEPAHPSAGGYCVQETFNGGYIVAGFTTSPGPPCWGILLKTDLNGNSVWCNLYGGYDPDIWVLSVKETADSEYIACGRSRPLGLLSHSALWMVKTNSQGSCLMMREYGDSTNEKHGNSVEVTNEDDYIFTGSAYSDGALAGDAFLFKTEEDGDSLWCTVYGGVGADIGNEVLQTYDGGYIIVGSTESYGAGGSDVWIIKTEPDVSVEENEPSVVAGKGVTTTIFRGPLQIPEGKKCKVFDIAGRVVEPNNVTRGIYFIEMDDRIVQKVVKVR